MKKICFIILVLVILFFNITPTVKATNSLNNNSVKFNEITDELKELDSKLMEVTKEVASLKRDVSDKENVILYTEEEIKLTEENVTSLQKKIEHSEEKLNKRLREMYKTNAYSGVNYLDFLFKSNSLSEFFSKIDACNTILNYDKNLILGIKDKVSNLNTSKILINEKKDKLVILTEETKNKLKEVQDKESSLLKIKNKLTLEKKAISGTIIQVNESKLITFSLSLINSSDNSAEKINQGIKSLEEILPHLFTFPVINKANEGIKLGKQKLNSLGISYCATVLGAISHKETYSLEATAYCDGFITKMGLTPIRNALGLSTVAVDPRVIPLGSKVYVEGYGYAIASDTGGVILGNKIDLFMNSYSECMTFGRRNITVHLIASPGEW